MTPVSPSGHSCLPLLAAWPLAPACRSLGEGGSTAGGRVTRAPGTATSPRKTRVGGVLVPPSGRSSRRRRTAHGTATGCRLRAARTVLGRSEWPNRDPIGEKGGANLYGFTGNAPIGSYDPNGRIVVSLPVLIGGIVVAGACLDATACVVRVSQQYWHALDEVRQKTGRDPTLAGTQEDALKHCVAACNLGKSPRYCLTSGIALWIANQHEDNRTPASRMDVANNQAGITVGQGSPTDCFQACSAALRNGSLTCLDDALNLVPCTPRQ